MLLRIMLYQCVCIFVYMENTNKYSLVVFNFTFDVYLMLLNYTSGVYNYTKCTMRLMYTCDLITLCFKIIMLLALR